MQKSNENSERKTLIQINTVCNTSTGKLMGDIQRQAAAEGYKTLSIVGRRKCFNDLTCKKVGNFFSFWMHVVITTLYDKQGYGSYFDTKKIVDILRKEKPDIIHLHNLHGYYLNLPVLFRYLSTEYNGKIFWTFHDCWPITGHCAYFTAAKCEKWLYGCSKCPNKKKYPVSLFEDNSSQNYEEKKDMFNKLKHLTIIVPSEWMAEIVGRSFMAQYPIRIVNNGIDLRMFQYTIPSNNLYDIYHIDMCRKIVLGVASVWDARKGLNDFINLSAVISEKYQIVLVGLTKRQIHSLPTGVVGIERTDEKKEMAMLYSAASVFMNPSLEESFSLVTVEALACGTPVIVLDTSAVKELVSNENGIVLSRHEPVDYSSAIDRIVSLNLSRKQISHTAQKYDVKDYGRKIMALYEEKQ